MIFTPEILVLVAFVPWIEQLWFHNTKMVGYVQGGVFVLDHTILIPAVTFCGGSTNL